jgi:hypothetical protein
MTRTRLFLAVSAAALAAASLSGCAVMDAVATHEQEHVFATHGDASAEVSLPEFVPADSTSIRIRASTSSSAELVRFSTAEALSTTVCEPGALEGEPPFDTTWWPQSPPVDGMLCADWQVFERDGAVYGWTN